MQAEITRIQLETAKINLEKAKDENAQYNASKELRTRQNRQRQGQLRTDLIERANVIRGCTHRQGGSPGRERKGEGPSALRVVILPDNRTLIMCANCPLRVFSPLPTNKNPERRAGESEAKAKARVQRYNAEQEEFEKLESLASQQLTPEAGAPMHCGKTFSFVGRDGQNILMPAPCDSYAQGR
ncbi:MAG TPA: hypothetical protein VGH29_09915, partial [Candidatus Binataceae bacterium]